MENIIIKADNVSKEYRLGAIGGSTLREDIQSWIARIRGKEDPNIKLGEIQKGKKGDRFLALNQVSFDIKKGEVVGIIGHNGAGKSTLLKLLSGVTAPTKGTISYNGRIASMLEIGTGFHPELSGRENIYMNGAILGMSKAEISKKFNAIVDFAEMQQFIDTPVKRYSSGMYVKLAFAVAAHLDSEIMVMDEVLAVGDAKFQQKCLGKMGDTSHDEGRTILYVSHQMHTIRQLCTRCIVLDHGKIVYNGYVDTAIGYYMGLLGDTKLHYEFNDDVDVMSLVVHHAVIRSIDILDSQLSNYQMGNDIHIRVAYDSNYGFKNVKLRMVVKYQDGTIVGAMLTKDSRTLSEGVNQYFILSINTRGLTPGKYSVDVIFYQNNETGVQSVISSVAQGFMFQIDDSVLKENQLHWLHQYWGHIQLSDIQFLKE